MTIKLGPTLGIVLKLIGVSDIISSSQSPQRCRSGLHFRTESSIAMQKPIAPTAMANRAGGRSAAVVVMALLAAMLIVGEAEAGRHHRHHRHHDSPPAPPGFNEPMAAPSPYFYGELPASPADSPNDFPFAEGPEAAGPEGSHPQSLSESNNFAASPFADSPFAFAEGPAPESRC